MDSGSTYFKPRTLIECPPARGINPNDNHISFQCESMATMENKLGEMGIEYVKNTVEEDGIYVDQIFFHDPDWSMIEVCSCDILPIIPLDGDAPVLQCIDMNCNLEHHVQQPQRPTIVTR